MAFIVVADDSAKIFKSVDSLLEKYDIWAKDYFDQTFKATRANIDGYMFIWLWATKKTVLSISQEDYLVQLEYWNLQPSLRLKSKPALHSNGFPDNGPYYNSKGSRLKTPPKGPHFKVPK